MDVIYGECGTAGGGDIPLPKRDVWTALKHGFRCRCPKCGEGALFDGYTTVKPYCDACHEPLYHHRADDFPPYLTIMVVGHIIVPAMLLVEQAWHPEMWIHWILWLPLTLALTLVLLRPIKGAVVALQWALYMHGFDPNAGEAAPEPEPKPAAAVRTVG